MESKAKPTVSPTYKTYSAKRILQRAKNLRNWKERREDRVISRIASMAIKDYRKQNQQL